MFLIEDLSGNTRWDTFVSAVPGVTWEDGLAGGHHRTVRKDRDRLEAKTGVRTLRVEMIHLAPITKIDPANKGYAVWIAVPGQPTVLAGFLDYNTRRRRGVLVATTPHPKFEVQVTIEQNKSVTVPGPKVILRKIVGRS